MALISRTVALPTLLVASVATPYVASHAPAWKEKWATSASTASPPAAAAPFQPQWPTAPAASPLPGPYSAPLQDPFATPAAPPAAAPATVQSPPPLEGASITSLAEVFRLDVTKEWVYQRWPRKSTALAELDLYGVRVPLVTGTRLTDLAGSLTYFFAPDGRLQRISFRGRTGDTTELVAVATQQFGLTWQAPSVAGEQLLQLRRGEDVLSEVRTRPAPVLWASTPQESFTVELELQEPSRARPLSSKKLPLPQAQAIVPETPAAPAKPAAGAPGGETADAKSNKEPWAPFFPRSRLPKGQIRNLNKNDMFP